ncbi:uncharacterized protein C8R40DRAFT_1072385 [Lentinula edodes]|uniref:uncharacterized protein n=1 Tax=Lentinula edodes TaxID=5353 RepID=UPI001E8EA7A5|nr:uncharacterized protein C8R40DRAFT_1072385 [Lentinula edodes]KAH7871637.1 hypothetical protein C8R40DRAFT_1072385 [Lentinula edodes]
MLSSSSLSVLQLLWTCVFLVYLLNIAAVTIPVGSPIPSDSPTLIKEEIRIWVIRNEKNLKTSKVYMYIGDQGFGLGNVLPLPTCSDNGHSLEHLGDAYFANTQDRNKALNELRTVEESRSCCRDHVTTILPLPHADFEVPLMVHNWFAGPHSALNNDVYTLWTLRIQVIEQHITKLDADQHKLRLAGLKKIGGGPSTGNPPQ